MRKYLYVIGLFFYCFVAIAAPRQDFNIVALGVNGGVVDGNLTAYLVRDTNDENYLSLDAGSLLPGIIKGLEQNTITNPILPKDSELSPAGYILRQNIKGYFISHAHLDHIAGLIISSTDDTMKPIYALPSVIDIITSHYFNWKAWPNFSDKGNGFRLSKYALRALEPNKFYPVDGTSLSIQLWPLSHDHYESSMALLRNSQDNYFAYFGDTGPDLVEKSDKLEQIWKVLGDKVAKGKLKGIIIEVSYPNGTPDKQLFGHLTPNWLITELKCLEKYSGNAGLTGLNIIISHIKPSLLKDVNLREHIRQQLDQANTLGVKFHLLEQGQQVYF